jgi:dimethylhistidine N-methyltransferase
MSKRSGVTARAADPGLVDVALSGLSRPQKTLPAKLFYDEEGCRLFYQITALPEYYLTRTERALLPEVARQVLAQVPDGSVLVEYGASDEGKAGLLLLPPQPPAAPKLQAYVPIDVAMPALLQLQARLARSHPWLAVHPIGGDFMNVISLPAAVASRPLLGFFPGSTIGNLDPDEATQFLAMARHTLGRNARFLIGADLRKDPSVLLPAYDDAAGVTAAFNRNMLVRLNREAGADFDVAAFEHRAVWNDTESRIEMHLVSMREQMVRIAGQVVAFRRGETIHTENSYKHTAAAFAAIADAAGWCCGTNWTDSAGLFSLYLLTPRAD